MGGSENEYFIDWNGKRHGKGMGLAKEALRLSGQGVPPEKIAEKLDIPLEKVKWILE